MNEDEEGNIEMADESKDWISKHWSQLTALVIVVVAFVTVQLTALNNSSEIKSIKDDIKPLGTILAKIAENKNKNLLTLENLKDYKKDQSNKWVTVFTKLDESRDIQIRTLTLIEKMGDIYPNKDKLNESIDKIEEKIRKELDKKANKSELEKKANRNELDARHFKTAYRNND